MSRYGSGSLFQRGKKGIWYYQAWVDGQQFGPYSSKSTDRRIAQRELDKLLGKRARGELSRASGDKVFISDLLADYLIYADERLKSARIIRWVVEGHLIPKLGRVRIGACDVKRLRLYRKERMQEGADDTTINRELSYLRAAWKRALKEGFVASAPYFPITQEDNARQGFITEAQFLDFLSHSRIELRPFAVLAYYGGLRRGEIITLLLTDLDLKHGYVSIRPEVAKNKTGRIVPITDGPMLEWLTWAYKNRKQGQEFVVVWEDGRPFTERDFYEAWHAAAKAAGIPNYIPHDSRRSASRNMRNEGISQKVRMQIMGHKTDALDRRYNIVDHSDAALVKEIMNRRARPASTEPE